MLLEYQIRNLKHLELALQTTDTITIIGQPKSGRKTVISSLNFEKSLFISIVPYTNQYQNCSDFLTAIKNIKVLTLNSYEISPEFSIGDILSIGIERKELFELENHLIKNIKRASRKYKIVLVVENFNDLDNGTKAGSEDRKRLLGWFGYCHQRRLSYLLPGICRETSSYF